MVRRAVGSCCRIVVTGVGVLLTCPAFAVADPTVSAVGQPNPVEVGQAAVFSASASTDSGASIIEYDWDFGDGDTCFDCGPSTAYTYQQDGQYTVTVTVTDSNFATSSGTITIDVTPVSPVVPPSEQPSSGVHGGAGRITLGGRVGALQLDASTEVDVRAFAGLPDATAVGNFDAIPRGPNYLALGYSCQTSEAPDLGFVDGSAYCRTVFYVNVRTGRLVGFHSASPLYAFRGASPRMRTADARRHIHRIAQGGCLTGFFLFGRHNHASLFGEVDGGHALPHGQGPNAILRISGGHLAALELESNRHPVGLLFC